MRDLKQASVASKTVGRSPYLLWLVWLVWLPFLIPPISGLIRVHPPLPGLIITFSSVFLYFSCYVWATWRNAERLAASLSQAELTKAAKWQPIVALTVLSIVVALLAQANRAIFLEPFIFTSAYVAGSLPTWRVVQVNAALVLLVGFVGRFVGDNLLDYAQAISIIIGISFITVTLVRLITTSRELRTAREEIARLAVMTERLRIARDLHDLLGHNLSLITLKSELARRLVSVSPEQAIVEMSDVEQAARMTLQEVREAVGNYRQPSLANELHSKQELLNAAGIAYQSECDESILDSLPTSIETVLSWTVREGITNVIRHSRAHQCTLHLIREGDAISVEIINDGANSFTQSPDASCTEDIISRGNGLRGLAERVTSLGGSCEAGILASGGFRLAVSVPVVQKTAAAPISTERSDREAEMSERSGILYGEGKIE